MTYRYRVEWDVKLYYTIPHHTILQRVVDIVQLRDMLPERPMNGLQLLRVAIHTSHNGLP